MVQRCAVLFAASVAVLAAGCGGEDTSSSPTTAASAPPVAATTTTEATAPATTAEAPTSRPPGATGTRRDRRGDSPPELDLVKFSARRAGNDFVIRWTLAAPPRGTLVAAQAETDDTFAVAAVKVYEDPSTPGAYGRGVDAYVFDGENHQLRSYSVDGRTVTLRVPDSKLGLGVDRLKASTERVGGREADEGPTVSVP